MPIRTHEIAKRKVERAKSRSAQKLIGVVFAISIGKFFSLDVVRVVATESTFKDARRAQKLTRARKAGHGASNRCPRERFQYAFE